MKMRLIILCKNIDIIQIKNKQWKLMVVMMKQY